MPIPRPTKHELDASCALIGCVIVGVEVQDDGTAILKLDSPKKLRLHAYVQSDPEGNGPGNLSVYRNSNGGDAEYLYGIGGN